VADHHDLGALDEQVAARQDLTDADGEGGGELGWPKVESGKFAIRRETGGVVFT
jgi:hypothetical protein